MKQVSSILNRLLRPPLWALIGVPAVSFASLAAVFACHYEDHALAYLTVWRPIIWRRALCVLIWSSVTAAEPRRGHAAATAGRHDCCFC